ncbi:MAG: hypothetical protein IJX69_03670 [Oscillospiraceae bacterium]|nr:hypothetical protein [Oscillospiraceae bacterium]
MNKNNMRFSAGGLLLVIFTLIGLMSALGSILFAQADYLEWMIDAGDSTGLWLFLSGSVLSPVLYALPVVALGIVLMMRKPGLPATIVAGIGALLHLVSFFRMLVFAVYSPVYKALLICEQLSLFLMFVGLVLLSLPHVTKNMDGMKKLWFLPGILYILNIVLQIVANLSMQLSIGGRYGFIVILTTLTGYLWDIPLIVSFFLAGRWMANPWKKQPAYAPQPGYAAPAQNPNIQAQLAYYEQLYRNGQITEQAYLNIRKQLTGR